MQQNFTQDLLIQYLYHETGPSATLAMETMMQEDAAVREEYRALRDACRQLPKVQFSPSAQTIKNILRYSENTAVTEQA